ncbi:MAG: glycosyltransferase family 4 protein, partial [Solirubrobacteraceae bacterium]
VVAHARQLVLHHEMDVTLVLAREQEVAHWEYEHLPHLHVASLADARQDHFDIVVATWWETVFSLFAVPADRYAYFVQSIEDRFYKPEHGAERLGAALSLDLPVAFITEATWIRDTLAELRPDARCLLVPNGVDKDVFTVADDVEPNIDGPLRVLVEGNANVWFKGVNDAIAAARAMSEPKRLTVVAPTRDGLDARGADAVIGPLSQRALADVYAETDVVLKLSTVEGMYGPPLEGFHKGATCVTTEVTGHEEYIEHGHNALLTDWGDEHGTARQLDLLARDRDLLQTLRTNALATARGWPSWEEASAAMAEALRSIVSGPAPSPYDHMQRLLADVQTGLETRRLELHYIRALEVKAHRWERIRALPGVGILARLRFSAAGRRAAQRLRRARG